MTTDNWILPPLPEIASVFTFADMRVALTNYGAACAANARKVALEESSTLVKKVHAAKGRHHSQLAMCDLYDAYGLPNERPKK